MPIHTTPYIPGNFQVVKFLWLVFAHELLCTCDIVCEAPRGGEKEHLVSTVCTYALISKSSWKTISLVGISVTLTSVRQPIFTMWKMHTTYHTSVWTMVREWWKHSTLQLQESSTHLFISAKCYYTQWCNLSFEVRWSPQTKRCRLPPSKRYYHKDSNYSNKIK